MKKYISLLIAGIIVLGLSACGSSTSTSVPATPEAQENASDNKSSGEEVEFEEESEPESEESEAEQLEVHHYALCSLETVFSEGLAWAIVSDEANNRFLAAINQNSEIVYMTHAEVDRCTVIATPFMNGLSAVYAYQSDSAKRSTQGFVIVDSEGNEVYTDDESYMCGCGRYGNFLVAKHDSGFSADRWLVSMLDSNLVLSESLEYPGGEEIIFQSDALKEFESGVFFREHYVANFNKDFAGTMKVVSGVTDDYVVTSFGKFISGSTIAAVASADELMNLEESSEAIDLTLRDKYGKLWLDGLWSDPTMFTGVTYVDEGNGEYKTAKVLDADLNEVFTYPALPEGASYRKFEKPSNGFYVAYMAGADGNIYATAFNEQGEMEYDPVMVSVGSEYDDADVLAKYMTSFAGYAITSSEIVDPQGNVLHVGDDLTALDNGKDFSYEEFYLEVRISEGFIYYATRDSKALVSLDGTTEISDLTATYDGDGQLVFGKMD